MLSENHININKSARYFVLGTPSKTIHDVWFVLHGYGQLANEFLSEFHPFINNHNLFVAPEALNKFYFRGFSGKIGASWMTKEDRENEIHDYIVFLNSVSKNITDKLSTETSINILGFSQGCHTAVRWLNKSKLPISKLVLWSGSFPNDVNIENERKYWSGKKIITVQGSDDKLVDMNKFIDQLKELEKIGLNVQLIEHGGKHKLYEDILNKVLN